MDVKGHVGFPAATYPGDSHLSALQGQAIYDLSHLQLVGLGVKNAGFRVKLYDNRFNVAKRGRMR
jgi:hypothetical protein